MSTAQPKILAFAGSARADSFNKKLIRVVAQGAREAGADVTLIDLTDYPMPIYDGDAEANEGLPPSALELKALFKASDGLLFACPEYNSSITPLLKNVIDWVSRPTQGEKPVEDIRGKVAGLVSASPGGFGGMRGLVIVRSLLSNIGVLVVPDEACVPGAHSAFDESGALTDAAIAKRVKSVGARVAQVTSKLDAKAS